MVYEKMTYDEFAKAIKNGAPIPHGLPNYYGEIDDEMMLPPKDVADAIGVHEETVRRWILAKKIPATGYSRKKIKGIDVKRYTWIKDRKWL
ncbi:helix-turn-helix domain-containing protein [Bacillus sp. BRMEA1]|uniref:helix-turn-helix domain-containing protein n=1 Tax=Neobacillus endophyticus TaxID=2738405 RepID=UPI00156301F9|nr:helix-turn-helix domain-containing protein [Neobacillus endophyticus]NRD80141.1 helix-turn-helix domain-containing protein [Neobacillus endophyticus]